MIKCNDCEDCYVNTNSDEAYCEANNGERIILCRGQCRPRWCPQYSKVVAWRELPLLYSEETNDEMICYEVQREDSATKDDKRFFNALKPNKEIDRSWGISREVPICPHCEAIISPMYFFKNCEEKVGWCEYCGQKIDWSGWGDE